MVAKVDFSRIGVEELWTRGLGFNTKIKRSRRSGIRSSTSLDQWQEERLKIEMELKDRLMNGKKLANPLRDYCARNLTGSSNSEAHEKQYDSMFEKVFRVEYFVREVAKAHDQAIIVETEGITKVEGGIIRRSCEFSIEDGFRNLYIPVSVLERKARHKRELVLPGEGMQLIPSELFSHPGLNTGVKTKKRGVYLLFNTAYGEESYIGVQRPKEQTIYIGNAAIPRLLERS